MAVFTGTLEQEFICLKIQLKQFANIKLSPTELHYIQASAEQGVNNSENTRLHNLYKRFSLGVFEQQLILMCLATDLDEEYVPLLARINQAQPYPTMALALSLFRHFGGEFKVEESIYDCLITNKPLRLYKIIELNSNENSYLNAPLRLADDILQYIISDSTNVGKASVFTPLLKPYCRPLLITEPVMFSEKQSAEQVQKILCHKQLPLLLLDTEQQPELSHQAVALMAQATERKAYVIDLAWLPSTVDDLNIFCEAIIRELYLHAGFLLLHAEIINKCDPVMRSVWGTWLEKLSLACPGQLIISAKQPLNLGSLTGGFEGNIEGAAMYPLSLSLPSNEEQQQLWFNELGNELGNKLDQRNGQPYQWEQLTEQFCFNKQQIISVARELKLSNILANEVAKETKVKTIQAIELWKACKLQQKSLLGDIAQVIPPGSAGWDDIILSPKHKSVLKAVVAQVQKRKKVYHEWGFGRGKSAYGLGISVLLSGPSGTGKTLAARIIANELQRDIYQIDLSKVADKYIGETEKNLEKIFLAAEHSGAILLFDEADALFGKRSKINDSKDRHANLGVSYLLQRMESYKGISILTSNFQSVLDDAFMRRIRFMVQFSFPDVQHRQNLWEQIFPKQAPKDNLDFSKLARLSLTGGSIRNIVLQAAFDAASSEQAISMAHILLACRHEFDKTQKTLSDHLVADW